jgi:hypothetical protein
MTLTYYSPKKKGKKANQHMRKEWRTLCETIYDCGYRFPDGTAIIRFGDLFNVSLIINSLNLWTKKNESFFKNF